MGFLKDMIFGSKPKATTTPTTTRTPQQQAVESTGQKFLQGIGNPNKQEAFKGPLVGDISNLEQLSLTALEDRAKLIATEGNSPVLESASQALIDILGRGPTDIEDFVSQSIVNPTLEVFDEEIRPRVGARHADAFFSGDRKRADAESIEDLIDSITKQSTAARLGIRQQDTDAIIRAAGIAPNLNSETTNEMLKLLGAGSTPREVETSKNLAEFERFKELKNRELSLQSAINSFLSTGGMENIVTTTPGSKGLLGSFIEGAGRAAGAKVGGAAGTKAASFLI